MATFVVLRCLFFLFFVIHNNINVYIIKACKSIIVSIIWGFSFYISSRLVFRFVCIISLNIIFIQIFIDVNIKYRFSNIMYQGGNVLKRNFDIKPIYCWVWGMELWHYSTDALISCISMRVYASASVVRLGITRCCFKITVGACNNRSETS